jgi:hypothetical protein
MLRPHGSKPVRLLLLLPAISAIGACAQKLDDGNPRASFITAMLDDMQRQSFVGSVELSKSNGEWPFSIDTTFSQLREDGFAPADNSDVSMDEYLAGDCASAGPESDGAITWRMDNYFDTSRLTYSVGIRVGVSCAFEGLWMAIHPEDAI